MMTCIPMTVHQRTKKISVFTIGHSTRPLDEFFGLLQSNGVRQLIDIRTIPKSRHNPQFNGPDLARALHGVGIAYTHLKALGGLRHPQPDSVNVEWRNASFRGFADYMQTPEFAAALARAVRLAQKSPAALMCAEAVPWRCHRSLVADALLVRGIAVLEIIGPSPPREHKLTPFARVRGTQITYPGDSVPATAESNAEHKDGSRSMIHLARVYDESPRAAGPRFLVERLWPRGMKKEALHLDAWLKDVAPSDSLRRWFGHRFERWKEFQKRYVAELRARPDAWKPIFEAARRGDVTLLYSARDTERNSAVVLQKFLSAKRTRK
jgi:uncharacterized protein YeaO (DUF488 family)